MQNNNLLKKAILALLLCVAMPCLNAQVAHVGDILCEGDLIVSPANYNANTHTAIGVVFYVDNTGQHGWAVALEDAGSYSMQMHGTPLPNYGDKRQAIHDLDGYENTSILRESHSAFNAVDFVDGYYVPTIGQWNYLYGNLLEVNSSLSRIGGCVFELGSWEYWSSTEASDVHYWYLNSSGELNGWYVFTNHWSPSRRIRAARNF